LKSVIAQIANTPSQQLQDVGLRAQSDPEDAIAEPLTDYEIMNQCSGKSSLSNTPNTQGADDCHAWTFLFLKQRLR
jgi:hypothetical protein